MESSTPDEAVDSVQQGMHDIALSDIALAPVAASSLDAHNHEAQPYGHQDTSYYGDRDGWNERRDSDPRVDDDRGLNSANAEHSSWHDNHRAQDTFEAVELDGDSSIQNGGHARRPVSDEHSRSSSPADDATTTPPLSPSLASTAPTTIASSSSDGPLPPTAAAAGEPVPGPSTPPETKPAPPLAAAQPKVRATRPPRVLSYPRRVSDSLLYSAADTTKEAVKDEDGHAASRLVHAPTQLASQE